MKPAKCARKRRLSAWPQDMQFYAAIHLTAKRLLFNFMPLQFDYVSMCVPAKKNQNTRDSAYYGHVAILTSKIYKTKF